MEVPQVVYEEVIVEVPEVEIKELRCEAEMGRWMRLNFWTPIPSTWIIPA